MSTSRSVEHQLIRKILGRSRAEPKGQTPVEWLIMVVAIVACVGLLAAFMPALLWVLLPGAFVLTLGA